MPSRLTDNFPTEILKVVLSFLTATDFATSTTTETSAGSNPKNTPSDDNKSLHNMDKSSSVTEEPAIPISIKTTTKGIWTIYQHVPTWTDSLPGIAIVRDLQGFYSDLPFVKLLLKDLWSMGPALVTVYVVSQVMSSIIPTLRLAQSAAFFHMVSLACASACDWIRLIRFFRSRKRFQPSRLTGPKWSGRSSTRSSIAPLTG